MDNVSYLAYSHAAVMERHTDIVANNMANANKSGFRASRVNFEAMVHAIETTTPDKTLAYGVDKGSWNDTASGSLVETGNPLDLAITGQGWFGYQNPDGRIALSRDGGLVVSEAGELVNVDGAQILDAGGGPIALPAGATNVSISDAGEVIVDGDVVAAVGIFAGEGAEAWSRRDGSMFHPDGADAPLDVLEGGRLAQGYVEQSNVNPVLEMVRLISTQRAQERALTLAHTVDELRTSTIQRLSSK